MCPGPCWRTCARWHGGSCSTARDRAGEFLDGPLRHSGLEEVVQHDMGIRRCRPVGLVELVELLLEAPDVEHRHVGLLHGLSRHPGPPSTPRCVETTIRAQAGRGRPEASLPASLSVRSLRPLCATAMTRIVAIFAVPKDTRFSWPGRWRISQVIKMTESDPRTVKCAGPPAVRPLWPPRPRGAGRRAG